MKFLVALSCLLAVVAAKPSGGSPLLYSYGAPFATGYSYTSVGGHVATAPLAYTAAAPVAYSTAISTPVAAPVAQAVAAPVAQAVAAPVVQAVATPVASAVAAPIAYSAAPVTTAVAAPVIQTVAAPVAYSAAVATPVTHTALATPVAAVATHLIEKTQYHSQDTLGQAAYGHSEAFQTHNAVQDAAGNKVGSYSYVAPDGQVISANYVADGLGYRVASNALPVAPAVVPVAPVDTPEVAAARIAHLKEHAVAKSRSRRAASVIAPLAYSTPLVHSSYAYSAPIVRSSSLTTLIHNPVHAVSYHVY